MSIAHIDARLKRAKEQIEALHTETRQDLLNRYRVVGEPQDSPPGRWRWHVKALLINEPPPLIDWAIISGEIVHNLRASLDNLAWLLAGPSAHGGTAFPISEHKNDWTTATTGGKSKKAQTLGMKRNALKAIHDFQPCFDRNKNTPLRQLRLLSNRDKHRFLQMGAVAGYTSQFDMGRIAPEHVGKTFSARYVRPRGPFDDSTILATIEAPENMHVQPQVTFEVLFSQGTGAANWPITNALHGIAEMIRGEVVPALYPFV